MVFLAFEWPSRFQWTRLHPLACDDSEPVGSATDDSKPSSLSSNDLRVCRQPGDYFLANNRGPDISTVDVVLSHHCAPKTENDTVPSTHYVRVMIAGVAMRSRIQKLKYQNFCWRHFSCLYENLHLQKYPAMRYTGWSLHLWRCNHCDYITIVTT